MLKAGMQLCLVDVYADPHLSQNNYGVFKLLDGPLAGELVEVIRYPIDGSVDVRDGWLAAR